MPFRSVGRLLQVIGLLLLPLAILLQLSVSMEVEEMLAMAVAGFAVFWIGRIVEGYAK